MKHGGFFLGVFALGLIALAGYVFGPEATLVGLVAIAFVLAVFLAFSIGNWWAARLMQAGAHIALQAQVSDDKRDGDLIRGLAEFSRQAKALPAPQSDSLRYPPVAPPSFVVSGLLADSKKEDGNDD